MRRNKVVGIRFEQTHDTSSGPQFPSGANLHPRRVLDVDTHSSHSTRSSLSKRTRHQEETIYREKSDAAITLPNASDSRGNARDPSSPI
jgi:hypothetical protein